MVKIYIISDRPEFCITASNMINATGNSAIISELSNFGEDAIIGEIKANLSTYDVFLVFRGGATLLSSHAGKVNGIIAASCRDAEEAEEIMTEGDVNAVFIDSLKISKEGAKDIVGGMLGVTGGKRGSRPAPAPVRETREQARYQKPEPKMAAPREQVQYQKPAREGPGAMSNMFGGLKSKLSFKRPGGQKEKPKKQRQLAAQDDGDTFVKEIKSKGINKAVKDALGITDE